ncbi:MAG: hypothetical protein M1361_01060 [Patescibacteria group bacterium]|nr:hypothetical protein [Patescibacteria group bacterium]MCL5224193.1 hypothetical protein [Patescibacteria group bacterium]
MKSKSRVRQAFIVFGILLFVAVAATFIYYQPMFVLSDGKDVPKQATSIPFTYPPLDIAAYNAKLEELANIPIHYVRIAIASSTVSSTTSTELVATSTPSSWPVKTVYPLGGAILPFSRIVAYYGNFYSKQMGVLGEYPPGQMISMLKNAVDEWQAVDTSTPVIPAIDYIAVAAQNTPGSDGLYSLRMPSSQIDKAISLAESVNGLVVLDVQIGLSAVETELPLLAKYLKLSQVELALDPEFSMRDGGYPGTRIGTMDAADINYAAQYLAQIVKENNLPPKILVIHIFTNQMVTNWDKIKPLPQVEIVMDMDGFGTQAQKIKTYDGVVATKPIQFTGFKLFYKNDVLQPGSALMTPEEILKLSPQPSFIQYE